MVISSWIDMCLHPNTFTYIDPLGRRQSVQGPCGHCVECLKDYQNSWKVRLSEEFSESCCGVFCTLTYDPETAPLAFSEETGEIVESDQYVAFCESNDKRPLSLRHSDVHAWVKRGREAFFYAEGKRPNFKYFLCGEYGPRTLRPHYHGLFLGIKKNEFMRFFARPWAKRFGFVNVSELRISSKRSPQRVANYVSKYCAKGMFENPRVVENPDCFEKPRRSMSKGIGRAAALRLKEAILGSDFQDSFYLATGLHKEYGRTLLSEVVLSQDWSKDHVLNYDHYMSKHGLREKASLIESFGPSIRKKKGQVIAPKRLPRYSLPYRESFIDHVLDMCHTIVYQDYEKKKSFPYKLPRYFRTIILGENSPLSVQCSKRLQERLRSDVDKQLEELQASHPDWTADQTYRVYILQDTRQRAQRAERAHKALKSFYSQSKV